ncbi:FtsX-like permease family protein [Companilactobacillus allii]|uniref:Peptide ABC transporter permease n=1 Tax=Companilactobacillus allii TaxID=1847728 RepID=A0A1P8Q1X8_9LACO|nr:FtsX-like permease family protein [Companilactobacillus allii]APX71883.1 peptide ABC transporter permease [Companilactobacillus allii]USQ69837.1 FtsX-like permease family protein [Companilactobacillus allii]
MKPLTRNMYRDIGKSKGRFIAIILIIMLGVLTFVGVKAAGPSLNDSLDKTVTAKKLSDIQVISTTGFTKKDIDLAQKTKGAKAETVKYKQVTGGKSHVAISLYGYKKANNQNQLIVRSGRLPKNNSEIILDQVAKTKYNYKLGDKFTFDKSADLKSRTYKVVGFASSPQYIDNESRGSSNVGDGTVRMFAYIYDKQMNLPFATELNVRFKSLQAKNTFTNSYKDAVDDKVDSLKARFKNRASTRTKSLLGDNLSVINSQQEQLDQAKSQLQQAKSLGSDVTSQEQTLNAQQAKLTAAKKKLQEQTKTTYTWQTREDLPGFSDYGESSDRIAAIANVFPVFFFLIAALITFTTITRMIEEARGQIGTFKALGYTKWEIAKNYFYYALAAGLIGTIMGAVIGNESLPRIVLALYKQYIPLTWDVKFQWVYALLALAFSLIATVAAAMIVVRQELSEGPADLMRPKAPKSAKKILLERIKPLWNHLSFNRKVSYRNLFRFKSRMFMTIIGIAGGTALILTGFGIQNSIGASGTRQYNEIFNYQAVVRLTKNNQTKKALKVLNDSKQYRSSTAISATTGKVFANGKNVDDVNIYTPENKDFSKYIHLENTKKNKTIKLKDNEVVLTKKMANTLNVKAGDSIKINTTNNKGGKIKVSAVTQNFVGHFMYLNKETYNQLFKTQPKVNTLLVNLSTQTNKQRNSLANKLLNHGGVVGTSYTYDQQSTIAKMTSSLKPIVLIFILLSGVLSFVVLYNLTNINVSERIRELSTIKVLGFYNNEVTMYIVRENIILTIMGIIVGYGVGNLLTAYILNQASTPLVIFPLTISVIGYIVATVLMILFTMIVMLITHQKLKGIDMIGALKSNE